MCVTSDRDVCDVRVCEDNTNACRAQYEQINDTDQPAIVWRLDGDLMKRSLEVTDQWLAYNSQA